MKRFYHMKQSRLKILLWFLAFRMYLRANDFSKMILNSSSYRSESAPAIIKKAAQTKSIITFELGKNVKTRSILTSFEEEKNHFSEKKLFRDTISKRLQIFQI